MRVTSAIALLLASVSGMMLMGHIASGTDGTLGSQAAAAGPAATQGPIRSVVELFTSQGCSSCPKADALFESYARRGDVLALSFNVDYWDYLGWKDTLANPKFTQRQRAYAKFRGDGQIYTPQMVVNGTAHAVGSVASEVNGALTATAKPTAARWVPVMVTASDAQKLVVDVGAATAGDAPKGDCTVWLATLASRVDVPIRRGENSGKTVTYHNVVRDLVPVGMWNGKAVRLQLDRAALQATGGDRVAVILQEGSAGQIIGAALTPAATN